MSLIEIFGVLAMLGGIVGASATAVVLGAGPLFVVVAALAGALVGPVVLGALLWAVGVVMSMVEGESYWPVCARCGARAFERGWVAGHNAARCACGRVYVRRGRECRELLVGGATRSYMRWRLLRGWRGVDDASGRPSADSPYRDERES